MNSKAALLCLSTVLGISSFAHANDDFWKTPVQAPKEDINFAERYGQMVVIPEKLDSVVRLDFDDAKEVPALFSQFVPGENFDRPRGISIYLSLTNDYNVLRPIVAASTDDHGYTHGSKIAIGGHLPSGHYMTFSYASDLYTKPIEGTARRLEDGGRYVDQHFTNENVLKIIIDTVDKNRGKVFYWKAEAGWQQLNSASRGGALSGATQQAKFHEMVNSIKPGQMKTPTYLPDGEGVRNGAILGIYLGVAKEYLFLKNLCRVRAFTEAGSQGSTINRASYVAAKVGSTLYCQQNENTLTYRAEVGHESRGYQTGYQGTGYVDLSTGKRQWRIGFRIEQSHGKLHNYQTYNGKNIDNGKIDTLFMVYYRYFFQ
ncbi:hypothetical protein QJS83_00920 [Bdellovibrio sp. 22V]|uniref:hypothetical protein n=1 Tax=Bdellovibrio TaxID=958 RepID=UPI002543EF9C|nr:hypothetical protein [Bdellovibrio sp. 22V]WII72428.1 hypothetical protein QJS83_00920 [Bdellovibrio sp. 22V]